MAKEESKLVEEVVETTDNTVQTEEKEDKFNPMAFAEDEVAGTTYEELSKNASKEDNTENTEEVEDTTEEDDSAFSWKKEEKEEEKNDEEEYNWEEESTTEEVAEKVESRELDWKKVAEELGVEATSKDEIVNAINNLVKTSTAPPDTEQVGELKRYLKFSDRDLVGEELKADGMDETEIEDSLDKLEDAGMIKIKAKSIRRVLNNAIKTQTSAAENNRKQQDAQRKEAAEKAKKELQNTIKDMKEFMGGKVTKKQKEEVYRYATGNMMNEIYASHANVADVAMFMLYRKQIEKILRSQGLEDGKAAIMDSIVSPNLNSGKGKSNFKVKSGKFDPKAFMSE